MAIPEAEKQFIQAAYESIAKVSNPAAHPGVLVPREQDAVPV
ncbi:hypothetical protein [Polyangium mundeleinium]|uniref:Uncharacterized protein n=1 Tax=Polyangium mundeleinium TaxID=2995306 RepID=A0ABT5F4Z5_9BACT|nr:hypothetical protein [Polyangium mundeleinium]MDC0748166.1 hypothetical protein [Polyangium mundeleinium]